MNECPKQSIISTYSVMSKFIVTPFVFILCSEQIYIQICSYFIPFLCLEKIFLVLSEVGT